MDKKTSQAILRKLETHYGSIEADLHFTNLYELTIAVVLSAQTTDKQVNNVTSQLFNEFPNFHSLAKARISKIEKIIKSTGFYKNKAKNIVNLSKKIMNEFNGHVPQEREELIRLPGIGRKSANVILSIGHNIPALAVDTHVLRISNRLGYTQTKNPEVVEKTLTTFIPEKKWTTAHLILIKHGRTLCTARKPDCPHCPIVNLCENPII